jgi:phosphatidylserine/phosphatidylglycerophosphate/cardiolipin synthase-like enzyme
MRRALALVLTSLLASCTASEPGAGDESDGKADDLSGTARAAKLPDPNAAAPPPTSWRPPSVSRWPDTYVIFNNTGCGHDCTRADQDTLAPRSVMLKMLNAAIRSVRRGGTIRIANYNISSSPGLEPLREALRYAMDEKGATVRIVMDVAQDRPDSGTGQLAAEGAEVRYLVGLRYRSSFEPDVERTGIMHSKMVLIDDVLLFTGSSNFSTSAMITNEENTVVLRGSRHAARIGAFRCQFERMFEAGVEPGAVQRADDDPIRREAIAGIDACEIEDISFPPSGALTENRSRTFDAVASAIRGAGASIDLAPDMLAHPGLVSALTRRARRAREAGEAFRIRVVLDGSEGALGNPAFGECLSAVAVRDDLDIEVRYWPGTAEIFQLLHHKMMLIDATSDATADEGTLWNGSANYSARAMRWSFENVARYPAAEFGDLVDAFGVRFERIFDGALTREELEREEGLSVPDCPLDLATL